MIPVGHVKSVVLTLVALAFGVSPCLAMTIRHDRDDQLYRDFANELGVGGALTGAYVGSGTLISPTWVLTAKHVLSGVTTFRTSAGNFKVVETVSHPTLDFGLARLEIPVASIDPVKLYNLDFGIDHGRDAVILGAGQTGTGLTGQISGTSGARRAGQTYVFANASSIGWSDTEVLTRFRSPSSGAAHLEAGFCNGDSGGGLLFDVDGEYAIAGVLTTAWTVSGKTYGEYVTGGGYTRSGLLNDWIQSYATDSYVLGRGAVHANLVAYDSFSYDAGQSIEGQSGGIKWPYGGTSVRRSWQYDHAVVAEGSLSYVDAKGNQLETRGNHVSLAAPNSATNTRATRWLTETDDDPMLGSDGGTMWLSYVARPSDASNCLLELGHGNATSSSNRRLRIGGFNGYWAIQSASSDGGQTSYSDLTWDSEAFVLIMIDFADPDHSQSLTNIWMWLNPLLDQSPDTMNADAALMDLQADYSFNHLQFFQSRQNWDSDPFLFDELRFGSSYDAVMPFVVPEPATWAICGACAVIMIRRRRRSQARIV